MRFVHPLLWYTLTFSPERLLRSRFVAAFFPSADSEAERTIEKKANSQKQGKADCPKGEFSHFLSRPEPENKKKNAVKRSTKLVNSEQLGETNIKLDDCVCVQTSRRDLSRTKIRNKCERIFYTPNTLNEINGFLRTRNSTESTKQNST